MLSDHDAWIHFTLKFTLWWLSRITAVLSKFALSTSGSRWMLPGLGYSRVKFYCMLIFADEVSDCGSIFAKFEILFVYLVSESLSCYSWMQNDKYSSVKLKQIKIKD